MQMNIFINSHVYERCHFGGYSFCQSNTWRESKQWIDYDPFFASLIPQFSLLILSSSECISWIDMQCSYFHFTPNKANTLFVWKRFKMSETTYICVNCNYTDSLRISFSLLFPSDQWCVGNSVQSTVCYPCLKMYHGNVLMMADIEIIVHTTILPQPSTPEMRMIQ